VVYTPILENPIAGGDGERPYLDVLEYLGAPARPYRVVQDEIERPDHEYDERDGLDREAVVIEQVQALRGEPAGGPGTHEQPYRVKKAAARGHSGPEECCPYEEAPDNQVGKAYHPDSPRGPDHVGQELLLLALTDIDLEGACGAREEECQRDDDYALAAGVGEEVAPHVKAVRGVVEVLDEYEPGGGVAAHQVKAGVQVCHEVTGEEVGDSSEAHREQPAQGRHDQAVEPGKVVPLQPAGVLCDKPERDARGDTHQEVEHGVPLGGGDRYGKRQEHDEADTEYHPAYAPEDELEVVACRAQDHAMATLTR
jgi:hypothetical protein